MLAQHGRLALERANEGCEDFIRLLRLLGERLLFTQQRFVAQLQLQILAQTREDTEIEKVRVPVSRVYVRVCLYVWGGRGG